MLKSRSGLRIVHNAKCIVNSKKRIVFIEVHTHTHKTYLHHYKISRPIQATSTQGISAFLFSYNVSQ